MSAFSTHLALHNNLQRTHRPLPEFLNTRINAYFEEYDPKKWGGGHIMRGRTPGVDDVRLTSNDYLSIAQHPEILQAMAKSILNDGNGLLMSGVFLHGNNPQMNLERKLAEYMHAEAGVLCQSGWCANTGLIQSIANKNIPVYIDMLAHTSLWEGIQSASANAVPFMHNDPEHLRKQVKHHGAGVIIVDSIYSTMGSICPLTEIVDISEENGCILVVDESHSLGTHGPHGEGLVVALGLTEYVHFRTASLAKAFAGRAGFITCPKRFSEYFRYESNPAIFSSTLLPHDVAGLDATLTVIQREDWRRKRLHANAAWLRASLEELGYNLNSSESQIVSLEAGPEQSTMKLRDALESHGIFGSVFMAPATPKNRSLIRFSVNALLTENELERIVEVCRDIREEVDMQNWPSTRRLRRASRPAPAVPPASQPELALAA